MNYIENVYLNKISPYIEGFEEKGTELWNCRCVYCGDSKKSKRIKRGYFLKGTEGNIIFSCRNCGTSVPLSDYIRTNFPQYYQQYKLDMFSKKTQKLTVIPNKKTVSFKLEKTEKPKSNIYYTELKDNLASHISRRYLETRGIEDIDKFGYTPNFREYVKSLCGDDEYDKLPDDERLIIPLKLDDGTMVGFQGRSLNPNEKTLRYITIKIPDMIEKYLKIFGLNYYDKNKAGFIVEGPFDSMFLPNTLAMCGTTLDMNCVKRNYVIPKNTIIILDNEPRNYQIVQRMYQYVDDGFRVYIPPKNLNSIYKDINLMVLNGWKKQQLVELFVKNSYTSTRAKLQLQQWKKV